MMTDLELVYASYCRNSMTEHQSDLIYSIIVFFNSRDQKSNILHNKQTNFLLILCVNTIFIEFSPILI
jgi:hypothetical protein